MDRQLIQRPQVYRDLLQFAERIALDNPCTALRFLDAAEQSFQFLVDNPHIGGVVATESLARMGLRVWRIKGFRNHLIFYIPRANSIEVVRVLHAHQDWEHLLETSGT